MYRKDIAAPASEEGKAEARRERDGIEPVSRFRVEWLVVGKGVKIGDVESLWHVGHCVLVDM